MKTFYCVKCKAAKEATPSKKTAMTTASGTRYVVKAKCPSCGTSMNRFVKK